MDEMKIKNKYNEEYTLKTKDRVINLSLTQEQIDLVEKLVSGFSNKRLGSDTGITIDKDDITTEQSELVIEFISGIFGSKSVQEVLDEEYIDFTRHAEKDRIRFESIATERNWDFKNLHKEIATAIKSAQRVTEIRIRFNTRLKESWDTFAYRIEGIRNLNEGKDGRLVLYFAKDPSEIDNVIVVVTILPNKDK